MVSLEAQSLVRALLCREPDKRAYLPADYATEYLPKPAGEGEAEASMSPAPINPLHLQHHRFFENMHFPSLLSYNNTQGIPGLPTYDSTSHVHILPPYVPPKPKDLYDTCNFDHEFTKVQVCTTIE